MTDRKSVPFVELDVASKAKVIDDYREIAVCYGTWWSSDIEDKYIGILRELGYGEVTILSYGFDDVESEDAKCEVRLGDGVDLVKIIERLQTKESVKYCRTVEQLGEALANNMQSEVSEYEGKLLAELKEEYKRRRSDEVVAEELEVQDYKFFPDTLEADL